MPTVLVTGGAGYVGSHCVVQLLSTSYDVVVLDNCSNIAKTHNEGDLNIPESLFRVMKITAKSLDFYNIDMRDYASLELVFQKHNISVVIHCAGLKAVGESVSKPLLYYENNILSTVNLLKCMEKHDVNKIIFSSSATVYGVPDYLPIDEKHPVGQCTNPYGKTKFFIEEILKDQALAKNLQVVLLRYFNPVGAHESGLIGEDPTEIPNNLMPYISQVAVGRLDCLSVFGNDYDTHDGTGVRDYIHVVDLAMGHVAALKKLMSDKFSLKIYNLGTGKGFSVLEMITAMEKASGKSIPFKIVGRRTGDVGSVYSDCILANKELQWQALRDLDKICEDSWRWQKQNPNGFRS